MKKFFETKYGYFTEDGKEYVVKTPFTPKPWVNVICPAEFGFVITNLGTGYTFYKNAALFRVTNWYQDLVKEEYGEFFYFKEDKKIWSLGYRPMQKIKNYKCVHGLGYTKIINCFNNFEIEATVFVPPKDNVKIWWIKIKNSLDKERKLELYSYLEWSLRNPEAVHNEFHKLFFETSYSDNIIFAKKVNALLDLYSFHSCSTNSESFTTNKEDFVGEYNSLVNPYAVVNSDLGSTTGRATDPIASFKCVLNFQPKQEKEVVFLIGVGETKEDIKKLVMKYNKDLLKHFEDTKNYWLSLLETVKVETDLKELDIMTNYWLKYQAISCRLNARTAYFQPAGGYGYRDQLQDSMVYLYINPELTKKQIILHAKHQFKDGNVYHWWHNIIEDGPKSKHSDPYLWLVFVTNEYIKHTGDVGILKERVEFVDDKRKYPLYQHCIKSIELSLKRFSKRELPLIGCGDWNDGLSAAGKNWKGESVWLAEFLYGILLDFVKIVEYYKLKYIPRKVIEKYKKVAEKLKQNVNKYCWDGEWFYCATKDNGELIGSKKNKEGKIFLNTQTWAIINNIVEDEERRNEILASLEKYLYHKYGPVLLYPAYSKPDKEIGYLTEYSPGVRENGGLYVHAGCWALLMECLLERKDKVEYIYKNLNPIFRSKEPDLYKTEPYVTCGDIYGPNSEHFGQGGWSWYSGSAQWLFKVTIEGIFGIKPCLDGIKIDPVLPDIIKKVSLFLKIMGAYYEIKIIRKKERKVYLDGKLVKENFIPYLKDGKIHKILVTT